MRKKERDKIVKEKERGRGNSDCGRKERELRWWREIGMRQKQRERRGWREK